MSEERKITAGTISGATLKSIDIEPSIIIDERYWPFAVPVEEGLEQEEAG